MVYDPETPEAKQRALQPIFTPPPTPTPALPSAEQLEADAKAAQEWATKLAAQPHRTEAEWREYPQGRRRHVVGGGDGVVASQDGLPSTTWNGTSIDEADVHTSIYALDDEFAVALTFDFKGDEAWNAAGQPKPRPKADENHLIRPPVLMRRDKKPDKYNEIRLETAHRA